MMKSKNELARKNIFYERLYMNTFEITKGLGLLSGVSY